MMVRSMLRRLVSVLIIVVLTALIAEGACRVFANVLLGEPYSAAALAELREQRRDTLAKRLGSRSEAAGDRLRGRRWHPYAGYTFWGPETHRADLLRRQTRRPKAVRLVILGGSVAAAFPGREGARALNEALKDLGVERRPEVWNLAQAGYRQPQQLFYLQTWLLMGLEPDIIVNLDGFNEVALGAGLTHRDANPLYPYRDALVELSTRYRSQPLDPETIASLHRYHRRARWELAILDGLRGNVLAGSAVVATAMELFRRRARQWDSHTQRTLATVSATKIPYDFRGVKVDFGKPPYQRLARLWRESSELLALISKRYGAHYLHLLQPNQYAAPGKPLSEEERRTAWRPDAGWPRRARRGYPFLKAEAANLTASGIAFHDLTGLFANERSTIYTDDCCHLNKLGNRLLAKRLAEILIEERMLGHETN